MNTEQISEQAKKAAQDFRNLNPYGLEWDRETHCEGQLAGVIQSAITAATAEAQQRIAVLENQLELQKPSDQVTCPVCDEQFCINALGSIDITPEGRDPIRRCPRCAKREEPCEYCLGFHDENGCPCHDCGTQMHPQFSVCVTRDGRPAVICPDCSKRGAAADNTEAQNRIADLERQLAEARNQRDAFHLSARTSEAHINELRAATAEQAKVIDGMKGHAKELKADLAEIARVCGWNDEDSMLPLPRRVAEIVMEAAKTRSVGNNDTWTIEETQDHKIAREPGLLIGEFGRYRVVDNSRYDNPSTPAEEKERAELLIQANTYKQALTALMPFVLEEYIPSCATPDYEAAVERAKELTGTKEEKCNTESENA